MGQRTKVLETEGATPKFLYAIIRQMDLKIIDWNRLALELDISNGHAALKPELMDSNLPLSSIKQEPEPHGFHAESVINPSQETTQFQETYQWPQMTPLPGPSFTFPASQYLPYRMPFATSDMPHSVSPAPSQSYQQWGVAREGPQEVGCQPQSFQFPLFGWDNPMENHTQPQLGTQSPQHAQYVKAEESADVSEIPDPSHGHATLSGLSWGTPSVSQPQSQASPRDPLVKTGVQPGVTETKDNVHIKVETFELE
ncbi:hypothetical protein N7470_007231 [Penicillium chermesinum]|nr:hypothetical protein N7470_007231 [Penicillium chermesinum]